MIKANANIFIDEFGNTHLNTEEKPGTFSHFIYASVIINEDDYNLAEEVRKNICAKHGLGPNIKSSNLKNKNFDRRKRILKDLVESLDFTVDVLVVDKNEIFKDSGLSYKQVFYKYFQSLFVRKYNERYESFKIFADKVGEDFRFELQEYVSNSISRDLFHQDRFFSLADDIHEVKLIQLADFICGSVGKMYCTSHFHERSNELFDILQTRMSVEYFPFRKSMNYFITESNSEVDLTIRKLNTEVIIHYLDNIKIPKEHKLLLNYFFTQARFNSDRFINVYELKSYLERFFPGISIERIRLLIRDLRYDGLFIISYPGKSGYKLATNYFDIQGHYSHFMRYIIPMLEKIQIINNKLSSSTFNEINPLEKDKNFIQLKKIIAGFSN